MSDDLRPKDAPPTGAAPASASASDLQSIARLARLVRTAQEVAPHTRTILKNLLLHELGKPGEGSQPKSRHLEPERSGGEVFRPNHLGIAQEQTVIQAPPESIATVPAPIVQPPTDYGRAGLALEGHIRQLVEADAPWSRIAPLAWELWEHSASPEAGTRMIELVFLYGSTDDLVDVLRKMKGALSNFYFEIHEQVRLHIALRLWRRSEADVVLPILLEAKEQAPVSPIERLLVFMAIAELKDPTSPFMYFRRFRREIFHAVRDFGEQVGLSTARVRLSGAKLAYELGHDDEARDLMSGIAPTDPLYDEALQVMLEANSARLKSGNSHYVQQLIDQKDDQARLRKLQSFFDTCRSLGGFRDRNRPALNDILIDPLQWFRRDNEIWQKLSIMLVNARDLETLLPNLLSVFKTAATVFYRPDLDQALWSGWSKTRPEDSARDQYWVGVASLHAFVSKGDEHALWAARQAVSKSRVQWDQPLPIMWKELHKAAYQFTAKNTLIMEKERSRLLLQLRMAADPDQVTVADIDRYIKQVEPVPTAVLDKLQEIADQRRARKLELDILRRRGQETHLRNRDLERMWTLAGSIGDNDTSWRIATLLHSRGSLAAVVRHAWEISGEKRTQYALLTPDQDAIRICLTSGIEPELARLATAIFQIGGSIPDLVAQLEPGTRIVRQPASPTNSDAARIDKLLGGIPQLNIKRKYLFPDESVLNDGVVGPKFVKTIPQNPWTALSLRLAEGLGLNAWSWSLEKFRTNVADIVPRLANQPHLRSQSSKIAKWLRSLTADQRAAWQDLASLSRRIHDADGERLIAAIVFRLSTLIYQNHSLALRSLQAMRVPVVMIWDLENWIASEDYSRLRKRLETANRVLVPNSLQRLSTIIGE